MVTAQVTLNRFREIDNPGFPSSQILCGVSEEQINFTLNGVPEILDLSIFPLFQFSAVLEPIMTQFVLVFMKFVHVELPYVAAHSKMAARSRMLSANEVVDRVVD